MATFAEVIVIVTADVDFSTHHYHEGKLSAFREVLQRFRALSWQGTFFFTSSEAEQVRSAVSAVVGSGHEIGSHGVTHGDDEEYDTLPFQRQEELLAQSKGVLSALSGQEIVSFRAPRVKVSPATYSVLEQFGFWADSSICSQRMDLISSNLINPGWLVSPRRPYHPSQRSVYRSGDMSLLVVPISALALPFISSLLYVVGLRFMKAFFQTLYLEAAATGKPIVYLFHPYEFTEEIPGAKKLNRDFRVHGLRFRRRFYRGSPDQKLEQNYLLWKYMNSFDRVRVMTLRQYVDYHRSCRG